jgi:hypothetical protein
MKPSLENDEFIEYLKSLHYSGIREINGSICCLAPFMFTVGLITKVNHTGYFARFCFENPLDAMKAIQLWDGRGDPPGPWLKQKTPVERHNPLLYEHKGGTWYEPLEEPKEGVWELDRSGQEFIWC